MFSRASLLLLFVGVAGMGCSSPQPPAKAPIIMSSPAVSAAAKVKLETLAGKKDLVCKMDLEPEVSFTAKHEGKTYGFCSTYCKGEFEKDPKKYLDEAAKAAK